MTRIASAANAAAAAAPSVRMFAAVALDFTSGMVRVHDGAGSLFIGGNEFLGVGNLGSIEVAEETIEVVARQIKMRLYGASSLISTAATESYQGRSATVYLGFVSLETNALIDTPEVWWEGRMDTMRIVLAKEQSYIELNCEHRLRREPQLARFTDEDQKLAYAGDRFFDLIGKIAGFNGTWGARGVINDGRNLNGGAEAIAYNFLRNFKI